MSRLFMGTTNVAASKTFAQVTQLLVEVGASRMAQEYRNGRISSMKFCLVQDGQEIPFILPLRTDSIFRELQKKRPVRNRERFQEQDAESATRIAWRQIYRWLEAQFALINLGMTEAAEVFLPYIQTKPNRTLFDEFKESGLRMLTAKVGE